MYVSQPGIIVSTLFPLPHWSFVYAYYALTFLVRWLGSPWHGVLPYVGACSAVWLALAHQSTLDAARATRTKWGSACSRLGGAFPKATEVDDWGWDGEAEDEKSLAAELAKGISRKIVGRRRGALNPTKEARERFEELGAECWREMERLRLEFEALMLKEKGVSG